MPVLGINVNYLTGTLCGVEDHHKCLFYNGIYRRKKNKPNRKQADMVLPVSPKVGLGNNYSTLNVYDVVRRVRRINKYNQLT